ncbi:MAG: hydrogenase expression/formation protein HypC [Clostridia bacterium]|jgi:hydrogenase expression/formation protein HypC|uniref:Hydrogenase assembly chaperone HypC n=1 Tax=Thermacetogenium phaeum TaxID=85874 RepID=A0A124FK03_9THEO|nr:MAG: Hydrogenase assembly chaperone HypC [Thermacetogenium phaeum]MDK2880430.1 hydrogenase expression/formation protein HypC [Clostridia bacterium]MDN5365006.1 hydrogenase expression/formation protein HypC [Thermacetogenium sp.]MDN5375203.1 hydrogenase expression/formation protein HypC [Thermacetogenium sp.]
MCLAIPARIVKIKGPVAEVDVGGNTKEINIMLTPEAKVGDYVLLHAGYAIQVIDEKSAEEIFDAWEEAYEALQ